MKFSVCVCVSVKSLIDIKSMSLTRNCTKLLLQIGENSNDSSENDDDIDDGIDSHDAEGNSDENYTFEKIRTANKQIKFRRSLQTTKTYDKFDRDENENELDNSEETDDVYDRESDNDDDDDDDDKNDDDENDDDGENEDDNDDDENESDDDDHNDNEDDDDDVDVENKNGDDNDDDDDEIYNDSDNEDNDISDNDDYDNDIDTETKRESIFESFYKKFHEYFNHKPTKHRLIDEQLGKRNLFFPHSAETFFISCPIDLSINSI